MVCLTDMSIRCFTGTVSDLHHQISPTSNCSIYSISFILSHFIAMYSKTSDQYSISGRFNKLHCCCVYHSRVFNHCMLLLICRVDSVENEINLRML